MKNEGYCENCHKRFKVNDAAWNKLAHPGNGNTLQQLDNIHACCPNPAHFWRIGEPVDISELVLAPKEERK